MQQTTLIVLAHPEPGSFNGHWARASQDASRRLGHEVLVSDLVSMGFDPVEKRQHYRDVPLEEMNLPFDPLRMQDVAARTHSLPADVATEIDKIRQADRILFHFPLWWFGPPAILKGWMDRCLVHGELHTSSQRFDAGLCRGKRVLFCVSTGSTAMESSPAGKEGDVNLLLWPLAYTLRYLGFTILQPHVVHGVHGFHREPAKAELEQRLRQTLAGQADLMARFDALPVIRFNSDDQFDDNGVLLRSAQSHGPFICHES